jgi:hypothetical protein
MKFGVFFQLPYAPWQSDQQRYREAMARTSTVMTLALIRPG